MAPAIPPRRRIRWGVAALVLVLHGLVLLALVRAFAPRFADDVVRTMTHSFDVPLEPLPKPSPSSAQVARTATRPAERLRAQGSAGAPGRKADPRDASVPQAAIAIAPVQAPPVAGTGKESAAGASASGQGTGAAGQGMGLGAGARGTGTGGGGAIATRPVKVAGDINSARDYPRESRDLRLGHQVVVILRVGVDGNVKSCRVSQPSPDAEANRITCRLATDRFRFRPARDGNGNPVEADYGWRQRWFLTGEE